MNDSRQYIVNASAHDIPLPDGLFHCCVTSPPYYSLRKYAGEQEINWRWMAYAPIPGASTISVPSMRCALGLEPTPEAYIGHLVLVFREVWRVLRDDGTCWVVMGDSYAGGGGGNYSTSPKQTPHDQHITNIMNRDSWLQQAHLHQGDLMLIPHRLALALQADGWVLRNDVVWAKVAPMPESVAGWRWERCRVRTGTREKKQTPKDVGTGHGRNDRGTDSSGLGYPGWRADVAAGIDMKGNQYTPCPGCDKCRDTGGYVLRRGSWRHTRAHEFVLHLVKGMGYFSDQERVREENDADRASRYSNPATVKPDSGILNTSRDRSGGDGVGYHPAGRNPRSVLTPSPESYPGAHYAVFPRTLIAPLIRATCPTRCCPVCGAPWAPVVERERHFHRERKMDRVRYEGRARDGRDFGRATLATTVSNYRPTCACQPMDICPDCGGRFVDDAGNVCDTCDGNCEIPANPVPGWLLDPFVGSGTALAVAAEQGVNAVGLDLSLEYLDAHAKPRIGLTPAGALDDLPLFAELEET